VAGCIRPSSHTARYREISARSEDYNLPVSAFDSQGPKGRQTIRDLLRTVLNEIVSAEKVALHGDLDKSDAVSVKH
jgi:hypothetical protein